VDNWFIKQFKNEMKFSILKAGSFIVALIAILHASAAVQLRGLLASSGESNLVNDQTLYDLDLGTEFFLEFEITPFGTTSSWSSILHRGSQNYERTPGIWFHPGSLRLHVRVSTDSNRNGGCDPQTILNRNQKYNIKVSVQGQILTVWIDDVVGCTKDLEGSMKDSGSTPVYFGDPWYKPADALVENAVFSKVSLCDKCDDVTFEVRCDNRLKYRKYEGNQLIRDSGSTFDEMKWEKTFKQSLTSTSETYLEFECSDVGVVGGFVGVIDVCGTTYETNSETGYNSVVDAPEKQWFVDSSQSTPSLQPLVFTPMGEGEWRKRGKQLNATWIWNGVIHNTMTFGFKPGCVRTSEILASETPVVRVPVQILPDCYTSKQYSGNDIIGLANVESHMHCQFECTLHEHCHHWTYVVEENGSPSKHCFLKQGANLNVADAPSGVDLISGPRVCGDDLRSSKFKNCFNDMGSPGNDISTFRNVVSAEDCLAKCKTFEDCTHFTWAETFEGEEDLRCWVKRGSPSWQTPKEGFDVTSGPRTCIETLSPTLNPSASPTMEPTESPSESPTMEPTESPSESPTMMPTELPSTSPTMEPTESPSESPTMIPTESPSTSPTMEPSESPSESPSKSPTKSPSVSPSMSPTFNPTEMPSMSVSFIWIHEASSWKLTD